MTKALLSIMRFLIQEIDSPAKVKISMALHNSYEKEKGGPVKDTPYAEIEVRGDGKYLPTKSLTHLFDPFSESQTSIAELGLWVSQRIIEEHGGRLEVKSSAEGKLAFQVRLPASS